MAWQATQPLSTASCRPRATSASPSVGVRSGGPSQPASSMASASHPAGARLALGSAMRPAFLPLLFATLLTGACTDRMQPSADRWSRSGELIAMSGGEGGARYACVSCHGARGEGNGFDAPRLAGLPPGYLQKQLEDYALGLRPHEVMGDAARFLDSHERVAVANFYAALPPQALPHSGDPAGPVAAALYARRCADCHGAAAEGTPLGPPLAAQPATYLAQQLQDWQVGKRRNDGNHEMLKVAQALTAEELLALSRHLAQIPPRPAGPAR
ncbi:MAG: c-type cytochrome [Rubrivivax sp.]|nr:MAG: c-type cytochrome [Rubrivivax sp.]